jgi:hypothetical protein
VNKTWAWTVVVIQPGYAVGTSNATVVCGSTSTVSFTVDPLCAVSGTVTFGTCASSATITATQIPTKEIGENEVSTEGSTEFGWLPSGSSNDIGNKPVTVSGGSYYIGHLFPGAYKVEASAGNCGDITSPETPEGWDTPYDKEYAVAVNYKATTSSIDFGFGGLTSGLGQESSQQSEPTQEPTEGEGTTEGTEGTGTQDTSEQSSQDSGGTQTPSSSQDTKTSQSQQQSEEPPPTSRNPCNDKLMWEVAQDKLLEAKILHRKVYEVLETVDTTPDTIKRSLGLADSYLEDAIQFFDMKKYNDAFLAAQEAISYYQEILSLLT